MEFFGEGEPIRAPFALSTPFDEFLRQQFLDVVVGPRAPQIHKIRLKNAFLQGNGGEGSQGAVERFTGSRSLTRSPMPGRSCSP